MRQLNSRHVPFCLGVGTAVLSAAALLASQANTGQQPYQVEVKVEAVLVNVLVVDRDNKALPGLKKENFRIYEDRVEQEIENFFPVDAPFDVALTLDTSYSTLGKLAPIQNGAIQFLDEIHPDDEVMVISFDDEVYLQADFTRSKEQAARAVKMTRTGESTHLYEAVYLTLEQFEGRPRRKVMVLFTDGVDAHSPTTSAGETLDMAKEADVIIYPIYFDTKAATLRQITGRSRNTIGRRTTSPVPGGSPLPPSYPGPFPGPLPRPSGAPFPGPAPTPMPLPRDRRQIEEREEQVEMQYLRGKKYLHDLAENTGGILIDVDNDLSNLQAAFSKIAQELRTLYTLTYVPSDSGSEGKFRRIEVKVDMPAARVRARKGYYR